VTAAGAHRAAVAPALLRHAQTVLGELLSFERPADQTLSNFFRTHRQLGQRDRALVAETVFAVLRRRRSLEAASGSNLPRDLAIAALVRVLGYSGRALEGAIRAEEQALIASCKAARVESFAPAIQADLPDWLWLRLTAEHGEQEAMRIARALLEPAPLDLRVNLARIERAAALAQLAARGMQGDATPYSPAGIRLRGKPAVNRDPLFLAGAIEVQDEGSQLLAYLLSPRRGEMVADFCAGAGGKTLALAMLMRGTGRLYAIDVSARRLAALAPRAARAGLSNVHPIALAGESDVRAKRLSGKIDRVLVDAPCSGFGTLRRNPDLKWRHGPDAVAQLAAKQRRILAAASKLVKPGGRLVYATCSILAAENDEIVEHFVSSNPGFAPLSCEALLAAQRIPLATGERLRLWPHLHRTDGFFAAAFERRAA
jgi:16S rRNA (cytosine967-C5)-methyltransferase